MNAPAQPKFIVFTDLDGTLLDHDDYAYSAAAPALAMLKDRHIPLVLASSKTAAEIAPLRTALGFSQYEAIVENGAGLLEPDKGASQTASQVVTDYEKIREILAQLPADIRALFTGFADWSDEEVARQTGLDLPSARAAKNRQFSEPGLWQGTPEQWQIFHQLLNAQNIHAQQGGRYISLSFGSSKADQMQKIVDRYKTGTTSPITIALGDAKNDIPMLEAADYGIIIPNPSHKGIPKLAGEALGQITRAQFAGPKGWNQSLIRRINDLS